MKNFHSFSVRIINAFQIKINHFSRLLDNEINICCSMNYIIAIIKRNCKVVMLYIYCLILSKDCIAGYCEREEEEMAGIEIHLFNSLMIQNSFSIIKNSGKYSFKCFFL